MEKVFECTFRDPGHGSLLSNLQPYEFNLDGYILASMEGFIQSLKFKDPSEAARIRSLYGIKAWKDGQEGTNEWQRTQTVWWNGKPYNRQSNGYQDLITRAYDALAINPHFRSNLAKTEDGELRHSIGKNDTQWTLLTKSEFMYQLYRLRSSIFQDA